MSGWDDCGENSHLGERIHWAGCWLLELGFCSEVEEFKIWSATIVSPASQGNLVKNVEAVNITNVCWNGILYSCQSYEISFLVR